MRVSVGVKSDVGRLRQANEDSFLVLEPLFAVADGMGGHIAGDVASSTAVDRIKESSARASASDPETLAQLVRDANTAIWEKSQSDPSLRGMGTTCTLLFVDDTRARIAHVGDSRAYLFRDGRLEQLTEDHTLVQRMVREGRLQREEAVHHPQRSIITRALGVDPEVSVDLVDVDLDAGDRVLLCSDGLSSMIDEASIEEILGSQRDPQAAADRLIDRANDAGGEDNITVVVIEVLDGGSATGMAETQNPVAQNDAVVTEGAPPPPPEPEPQRIDTPPEVPEVHVVGRRRRGKGSGIRWRLIFSLVLVVVLLAGGYVGTRWMLGNSYYVSANESGQLSIFSGVPEEVFGFTFQEIEETSGTSIDDLPKFKRAEVREGIKGEDLDAAQTTLSNLERLAADFQRESDNRPEQEPKRDRDNNRKSRNN
ncbi:MAG: Stp1/IreP family PP2C-type Ser/Thr phosphatase [Actinomycetota bacterium]